MPTRRGIALVAGGVLCWLVGRVLGVGELYVVAVAAVALVGVASLAVGLGGSRVSVRRRLSTARSTPDQPVEVAIDLRNDGRLPTGLLLVEEHCPYTLRQFDASTARRPRFLVPSLEAGRTRSVTYRLVATTRGRWTIGPLQLHLRDPFGVVQRSRRYGSTAELLVFPRVVALPTGPRLGAQSGSGASDQRRLLGSGEEFHTIREYRTGDDLRRVHWASTARQQRLMVRQNEHGWSARATVLLDTRAAAHHGVGQRSTLEAAVTAAASVLSHLDAQSYDTQLMTTHRDSRPHIEPLHRHLERLAEVEAGPGQSVRTALDALHAADGLLVAVLAPPPADPADDPDVRALIALGKRFGSKAALLAGAGSGDGLVALLLAARWRATTLEGGVGAAWRRVLTQSTHRLPA